MNVSLLACSKSILKMLWKNPCFLIQVLLYLLLLKPLQFIKKARKIQHHKVWAPACFSIIYRYAYHWLSVPCWGLRKKQSNIIPNYILNSLRNASQEALIMTGNNAYIRLLQEQNALKASLEKTWWDSLVQFTYWRLWLFQYSIYSITESIAHMSWL